MHLPFSRQPETGPLTAFQAPTELEQQNSDLRALLFGAKVVAGSFIGVGISVSTETVAGGPLIGTGIAVGCVAWKIHQEIQ